MIQRGRRRDEGRCGCTGHDGVRRWYGVVGGSCGALAMTDRLALANAIVDAGIERTKAERLASMIVDLIHDEVALLGDISKVQARLRTRRVSAAVVDWRPW